MGREIYTSNLIIVLAPVDDKLNDITIFGNNTENDCFRFYKIKCSMKCGSKFIIEFSTTEYFPNTIDDDLLELFYDNTEKHIFCRWNIQNIG